MADDKIICKKCGGKMRPTVEASVQGLKCEKCGEWAYLTTYLPEICRDRTIYSVFLRQGNQITSETIKSVAAVAGCNFIKAKELLCKTNQKIFEGTAQTTSEAVNKLKAVGINYVISPDFKYDKSTSE